MTPPSRREFLAAATAAPFVLRSAEDGPPAASPALLERIEAFRPGRLGADLAALRPRDRIGASHVAGLYAPGQGRPFLVEGAERLIALGTRAAKFWFTPRTIASSYPWGSDWGGGRDTFVELARTDDFRAVFDLPFSVIALEALLPHDEAWRDRAPDGPEAVEESERAIYDLARHLLAEYRDRPVTFILQNWESDWRFRGATAETWSPPAEEVERLSDRMVRWLAARQRGVERARAEHPGARCRVAHAAEVNRVLDGFRGVPNVTRNVLPRVELDLVSYSCYDALASPATLAVAIEEIRRHARPGPLFGPGAVMLGEIGVPENEQPERIAERWDGWIGVALALDVPYVFQWQLYCNEPRAGRPRPDVPIRRADECRGFFLVRPDGTLGETGRLFAGWWRA
ncbi:hypothetical protein [Paludisphaera sp.]|uniref:hypothetical protein n=1 Tax=Paludisphaera sp. TaxID=2017432 RepID=UPI00301D23D5